MDQYLLGWSNFWDHRFSDAIKSVSAATRPVVSTVRIVGKFKSCYQCMNAAGALFNGYLPGKMLHQNWLSSDLPAVGDWCVVSEAFKDNSNQAAVIIEKILPRRSQIKRLGAGQDVDEQLLASNVDLMFIVTSINRDFNINRLRRFILLAQHGDVTPVIVLSKSDLAGTITGRVMEELDRALPSCQRLVTSALENVGLNDITALLKSGTTGVFVGSSGVGKSTLVNRLLSEDVQKVHRIRQHDDRGMHTTSSSGLFFVPNAGMIIDTPGLREVRVIADEDDLDRVLPGVQAVAANCQFRDCSHSVEPGCAVLGALGSGQLAADEFSNYRKLQRELQYTNRRVDKRAAIEERKRWKKVTVQNRQRSKERWEG